MKPPIELTLYGRPDCGLCQEMLDALADMQAPLGFAVRFIDIDDDPELLQRFNTLIPVLARGEHVICQYHLDHPALEAALSAESK